MGKFIFFCGEPVADYFPNSETPEKPHLGGTAYHMAMAAAQSAGRQDLNHTLAYVGPVANDEIGEAYMQEFADKKIETKFITRYVGKSRSAIIRQQPNGENVIERVEHNREPYVAPDLSEAGEGNIHVFSSSTRDQFMGEWLPLAHRQYKKGVNIYDVNIRPSSLNDDDYLQRLASWLAYADVIKVSTQDIEAIIKRFYSGQDMDAQKLVRQWMQRSGAKMVVVTDGGKGATAYTPSGGYFSVPAKPGKFDNTLGAGDAFDAGLAMGLAAQQCYSAQAIAKMDQNAIEQLLGYADGVAFEYLRSRNNSPLKPQLQNQPRPK